MCFRFACWWKHQKEWHYSLSISRTLFLSIEMNTTLERGVHYTQPHIWLFWTNGFWFFVTFSICDFWSHVFFPCLFYTLIWRIAWLCNLLVIQIIFVTTLRQVTNIHIHKLSQQPKSFVVSIWKPVQVLFIFKMSLFFDFCYWIIYVWLIRSFL